MQMMVSKAVRASVLWISAVMVPLAGAQTRVSIETEAGVIEAVLDDQRRRSQ
jgi:hypothetical protein